MQTSGSLLISVLFLLFGITISGFMLTLNRVQMFSYLLKNYYNLFKGALLLSLLSALTCVCYAYYVYMYGVLAYAPFTKNSMFFSSSPSDVWSGYPSLRGCMAKASYDMFSLTFLLLAYGVAIISGASLDTRFFFKNMRYFLVCPLLLFIVTLFTLTTDVVLFFLLYELLLLPSFVFVYNESQNRKAVQASLYFLIWTQLGSFLVLVAVVYMSNIAGTTAFKIISKYTFTGGEVTMLYTLLYVGFGIKVPIYPFHYWLTKTHVEAPTGFSIYLSGFLVKSAVLGFYKLTWLLSAHVNATLAVSICAFGVIDASLKMWSEVDLKKLVAFGTVQEMNLIFLMFCYGDANLVVGGALFCFTHGFLSAYFFFVVDCFQRRCCTRSVVDIYGMLHLVPTLSMFVLVGLLLYAGLPGTLKFVCEVYLFSALYSLNLTAALLLILASNFVGIISFAKNWFNVVFGVNGNYNKNPLVDLSYRELFIFLFCIIFLTCFGFSVPLVM